jgi:hypothetical protein
VTDDHCHRCGTPRPTAGSDVLTWVREQEPDGPQRWLCPACARRHVRDIEARLAPEWW